MTEKKKAVKAKSGSSKPDPSSFSDNMLSSLSGGYGAVLLVCVILLLTLIFSQYNNKIKTTHDAEVVTQAITIPVPTIEVPEMDIPDIVIDPDPETVIKALEESAPPINIPAEPDGGSYAEEPKDWACGYIVGVWTDEIGRDAANKNCDVTVLEYMGDSVYFWNVKTRYMSDVTNFYYL